MNKSQKNQLKLIIFTIILLISVIVATKFINSNNLKAIIYLIPYFAISFRVLKKSFLKLKDKDFLDENFLMAIASIGAFILGEYIEAVAVILLYTIGELFENIAVGKSRKSISALMNIAPETANVIRGDIVETVSPYEVSIDDIIIVKPGEKVPLDGVVTEGCSSVDTSSLTGESIPQEIGTGDNIFAGCINTNAVIKIRVTKEYRDCTVSKILELVEDSALNKSKSESFISEFAKYYTPIVVALAFFIAVVPSIITGNFSEYIKTALIFLVVSCPCALVISVPLTFFAGIGAGSKKGILIKGSSFIEKITKADTVIFDKTGTLTKGVFEVTDICGMDTQNLIEIAAKIESYSSHPIALSIINAYGKAITNDNVKNIEEIPGCGICAEIDNIKYYVGNYKLMEKFSIKYNVNVDGTVIHIADNEKYLGYIVLEDVIKENTKFSIQKLKKIGIKQTIMLTGDKEKIAQQVAEKTGIDEYKSELFPQQKVEAVENYINSGKKVIFVGDGINDAPTLARCDVGIAMGGIGSDSAIEAADIVIMDDKISKIPTAISMCKKTMKIVKQNIVFAIGVKVLVMVLSVFGFANMWLALFADVGVSVIAILNAMRAFGVSVK